MAVGFGRQGIITEYGLLKRCNVVVASLTAGSAMLMWIGERITKKVLEMVFLLYLHKYHFRIPSDMTTLYENFIKGKTIAKGMLAGLIIFAIIMVVVVFVLILNGAERRIPVQYSKKMVGKKMMGGQSTNIPLKVNTAVLSRSSLHLHYVFPGCYCTVCRKRQMEQVSEVRFLEVSLQVTGVTRNSYSTAGGCSGISYFVFSLHISTHPLHLILWKLLIISKSRVDLFRVFVQENLHQII